MIPRDADFPLEVMGHNLTEEKKRAFAEEAVAMLTPLVRVKLRKRVARLLGIKTDSTLRSLFSSTSSARRLAIHSSWTRSSWQRNRQSHHSPLSPIH
jgi:hypothetical protein